MIYLSKKRLGLTSPRSEGQLALVSFATGQVQRNCVEVHENISRISRKVPPTKYVAIK
jgi:hypothetical protein